MLNRNALMLVAGAALFIDASTASAQDTTKARPRSSTRIPVTKDSKGEVALPPKADTVMVYRTDTLRMQGRTDTVTKTMTNTVTKYDTVTQMVPMKLREIGGFYYGIGVGSSLPAASFNNSDHPGWRVEVPFGIDPVGSPLGVRFNVGYGRYEPHSYLKPLLDNAQMMNADADLKLRMLSGTSSGLHVQLYAIGGGSYNRFKNILETNHGALSVGDGTPSTSLPTVADNDWHQGWGYNAGGGVQLGHGITNVFVESRYVRFSGQNSQISHIPIVVGMSWY